MARPASFIVNDETRARLQPIGELNALGRSEFADALRPLFEAGPLAAALHAERPFDSYADLLGRAESAAGRLSRTEQIQVLSGHSRLGESADAVRNRSALSFREQGYDAEASLPADEVQALYKALADLNRAYEERFGFRFVVFVNGRPKAEIVKVLQARLRDSPDPDQELQAGLLAMFLIARDRLAVLSAEHNLDSE
jgi:2-oxo-4-hydroxy-4-carboxy--5-ureidoimidazoline (OHCU) decarboxylase